MTISNQMKSFIFVLALCLTIGFKCSLFANSATQDTKQNKYTNSKQQLPYNIYYTSDFPLDQQVLILTDFGPVVIVLNTLSAPISTSLFMDLIRNHYYDNTTFYRMYNDYFIQAGDPGESGVGNAGVRFPDENQHNNVFEEGTVALTNNNNQVSSTGSQFFITFIRSPWLDGKYTIIGNVVSGLDTLRSFFGKYETDFRGIMHNTIPLQVYILDDYIKSHPEYQSQFIATKFNKKSLLKELLNNDSISTTKTETAKIDLFSVIDDLYLSSFNQIKITNK